MKENRLVEIPLGDWPTLRDLYSHRKTESGAYNLIQNYINWLERDPTIDFAKFYSLNGDWSDGTFLFQENGYYITFNTLNESYDRLFDAISCLDKKSAYYFSSYPARYNTILLTYFSQLGLTTTPKDYITLIWHGLSREEALKFDTEPPEGITLSPLRQEDVDTINSVWPHRHPGSEKYVSRLIAYNPNIGAYTDGGELVAWCLQQPVGCLGLLQVKETHKRKGYGNLLVRVLSKKFSELGIEITSPIVVVNTASLSMFEKLGFKAIDKVLWLKKPKIE